MRLGRVSTTSLKPIHNTQGYFEYEPSLAPLTGKEAVIHGSSVEKYNGLHVTAGAYNPSTKRYSVELPNGDMRGLKPEHLRRAKNAERGKTDENNINVAKESLELGDWETRSGKLSV